jgi:uncharacterized protein (UPF0218 family)
LKGLRLTEEVREKVIKPLGSLVTGSPKKTMSALKDVVDREKPTKLFAVGDIVTSNLIQSGINTDLFVIDNKTMRKPIDNTSTKGRATIAAYNPAGTITSGALEAVKRAVENPAITGIIIDGEEDLLTLPIIKFAPTGAIVVYGQPGVGIVIVRITEKKKKEIEQLLDRMEEIS